MKKKKKQEKCYPWTCGSEVDGSLRCTVVWKNWQNKRNDLQTSLDRIRKCYGQTLLSACCVAVVIKAKPNGI